MDQGIHSLAQRKLQLDAAVLQSGGTNALSADAEVPTNEAAAMQQVMQGLLESSAPSVSQETDPAAGSINPDLQNVLASSPVVDLSDD